MKLLPKKIERRKPRLLIIGHGRHGKDSFAELIAKQMNLSFVSSSEFVGRHCIWPQWGKERYVSFNDMFDDRSNFRSTWANLILAYNTPNLARTAKEMMQEHDLFVGMRNHTEFEACVDEDLFDYVIWVDASHRHPPEPTTSMQLTAADADLHIDNNGPEENLTHVINNLRFRLHREGFLVNQLGPGHPDYQKLAIMEKIWEEIDEDAKEEEGPDEIGSGIGSFPPYTSKLNPKFTAVEDNSLNVGEIPNEDDPTFRVYRDDPGDMDEKDAEEDKRLALLVGDDRMKADLTFDNKEKPIPDALGSILAKQIKIDARVIPVEGSHRDEKGKPLNPIDIHTGHKYPPTDVDVINELAQRELRVVNPEDKPPKSWADMPENACQVLDHGFFRVMEVMGTDHSIAESARMSYGRGTKKTRPDQDLINYLVRNGHTSPLEMGEIKFHIRMPIFVMRQWVRHRTANLNEYSGRYSEMVPLWYVPEFEQICYQDKVNKQGSAESLDLGSAKIVRNSIDASSSATFSRYKALLGQGVSRETARIILPLNTYTEVVWKLDISNLIKFLRLRDDDHAQWEIQQYAKLVSEAVERFFPLVFAAYKESRDSVIVTQKELYALITGDKTDLSKSQFARIEKLLEVSR